MFLDCSNAVLAVPVKTCTKCGEAKIATTEYFRARSNGSLRRECIECARSASRAWYNTHKTRAAEIGRAWREANRERMAELHRLWNENNKERKRQTSKAWKEANKERYTQYGKAWREANRERRAASHRAWNAANPSKAKAIVHRRRARVLDLLDSLTPEEWDYTVSHFDGCCAVCGRQSGLWHRLAADHWIPISSPDCPGTVAWNMVPLCHGVDGCNNSKHDRDPADWLIEKFGKRRGTAILKRVQAFLDSRRPAS